MIIVSMIMNTMIMDTKMHRLFKHRFAVDISEIGQSLLPRSFCGHLVNLLNLSCA